MYVRTYKHIGCRGYTRGCIPVLAPSRHSPELMKDADKGHNAAARHGAAWARNAKWHSGVAPTTDQATAAILGSLSSPSCGALEIRTGERPDEGTSIPGRFPEGSRDSGNIRILGQRQPTTNIHLMEMQVAGRGEGKKGVALVTSSPLAPTGIAKIVVFWLDRADTHRSAGRRWLRP